MKDFKKIPLNMLKEMKSIIKNGGIDALEESGCLDFLMSANGYEDAFDCGNHCYLTYNQQIIGEIDFYIGKPQRNEENALVFFDEISQEAFDLWHDCLKDSDRHRHQILQTKFVFLSQMSIHPELRNLGFGALMLSNFERLMKSLKVGQIYLVSSQCVEEETVAYQFYQKMNYKPFKKMGVNKEDYAMFKRL